MNKAQSENIQLQLLIKEIEVAREIKKSDLFNTFLPSTSLDYGKSGSLNNFFKDENWDEDIKNDMNLSIYYNFAKLLPNSKERGWLSNNNLRISSLELRYKESLNDIQGKISTLVGSIKTSAMKSTELESSLRVTKEILDGVKEDYLNGKALFIELELAENSYRNVQINVVNEKFNYNRYIIKLRSMVSMY